MKRFVIMFAAMCVFFAAVPGTAYAAGLSSGAVPSVGAPEAVLMESRTGEIIYEKNAHTRRAPASVTKVMTLLLIAEDITTGRIALTDTVTASARAASFGGSCVYLAEGEQMSVAEMLKCIAVVSANDCAVAMAEHISGSEEAFVHRMNERAEALGLRETHFNNCTGLFDDDNHYTSAYDVAVMSRELLKHEFIKDYTTIWMDTIRGGDFGLSNTNRLVYSYSGCTGLKTGYTEQAKYCLSATAKRDGVEYIAVVMGAESADKRNADAAAMLDFAFANYTLLSLRGDVALPEVRVELGRREFVPAVFGGAEYALTEKSGGKAEYALDMLASVPAPVKRGDRLGTLTVKNEEKVIASVPILAGADADRLGYLGMFTLIGGRMLGL